MESSCRDIPAPGVGAECGPCPSGFTGDGNKCLGKYALFDEHSNLFPTVTELFYLKSSVETFGKPH